MKKINPKLFGTIGGRIQQERIKLNLTQEQLGKKIHLTKQHINYYECNTRDIPVTVLQDLSKLFNVSVDYLLGNIESKELENNEISRKLGLSDKSIEKLSLYAEKNIWNSDIYNDETINNKNFSIILNKIIENDNFQTLLFFIRRYINSLIKNDLRKEALKENIILPKEDNINFSRDYTYYDIIQDCIDQGILSETYIESYSDVYLYKINNLFNEILNSLIKELTPQFSNNYTLNNDKTKIIPVCFDNSENFKIIEGYEGISFKNEKGDKKNGSSRNNKK